MKVKELIVLLRRCNPNSKVTVWDAYYDCEDNDVRVCIPGFDPDDRNVHIGSTIFGEEITSETKRK